MNFDVSTVQRKRRKFLSVNDLHLKMLFDAVKYPFVDPAAETLIDGVPLPKLFGKCTPFTPIFGNVLQGSKKGEVVDYYIATLLRQQRGDTVIVFVCPVHDEP